MSGIHKPGEHLLNEKAAVAGHGSEHVEEIAQEIWRQRHSSKSSTGKIKISEVTNGKVKEYEQTNDAKVQVERNKLNELARKKISDPLELAKFQADMSLFESRSTQLETIYSTPLETLYKKQGLTAKDAAEPAHSEATREAHNEIARTYHQISRLLEAKDNPNVPYDQHRRTQIAEQVISHAANPTLIDQGNHPTCNVTAVEVRSYIRTPAEAARLVVDVSTTGEYLTTADHTKVKIDRASLEPDIESQRNPPPDGRRGLSSQVFQIAAINIYYAHENSKSKPPGKLRYEQHSLPSSNPLELLYGSYRDRVVDYATNPPQEKEAGISRAAMAKHFLEIGNQISGDKDKASGKGPTDWIIGHAGARGRDTTAYTGIATEQEFQTKLEEAKKNGRLPILIEVFTGNEPFHTDSGFRTAGDSGEWHVVNVTNYYPGSPAKVSVDNSWGSSSDHSGEPGSKPLMSVHALYMTMREPNDPGHIADLRIEVENNRKNGVINDDKVLDLLTLQMQKGGVADYTCQNQLQEWMFNLKRRLEENQITDDQFRKLSSRVADVMHDMHWLPWHRQFQLLEAGRQTALMPREQYITRLADALVDIKKQQQKAIKNGVFTASKEQLFASAIEEYGKLFDELTPDGRSEVRRLVQNQLS